MSTPLEGMIVDPNNPESLPRAAAPPSPGLTPVDWDALEDASASAQATSALAARISGSGPKESATGAAKAKPAKESTSYADLCALAQERYEPQGFTWKIRVERTAPASGAVKGIIGTYGLMTDEEFDATFGGQKYRCVLLLEEETPAGQPILRATTHVAEFNIAGPPKTKVQQVEVVGGAASVPSAAGVGASWGPPGTYAASAPSSPVDIIEAKAAVDREQILMRHVLGNGGSNALEKTLETQSAFATSTIHSLQEQVVSLNNALSTMRTAHANEIATERTRYRDLEESISGKVTAARAEGESIARAQFEARLTSSETRLDLERRANSDAIERERRFATETVERERESSARRVAEVERSRLQEVEMLKNEHERTLNREKDDRRREVEAAAANFKMQLDMIDRQALRDAKSSGDVQQLVLEGKNTLITTLTSEKSALQAEVAGLRAQVYVPFDVKLKEVSATAVTLGFKPPGEEDDDEDDDETPPAPPPKSAFEQMMASLPQIAPMMPGILAGLGQFAGIVPGGTPPAAPQQPAPRQIEGPAPQPYVPPPQVAPVVGQPAPVHAAPVISERRPPRPQPSPMPAPVQTGPTPISAPAGFVARGPQPEQPGQIEELLGTLSTQAKNAIVGGMSPSDAATLLRNGYPERAAGYHAWIDAENALVLLERSDLSFWSDLSNREWFDAFWGGLGSDLPSSLSGSLDKRRRRRSGTRPSASSEREAPRADERRGAFRVLTEAREREWSWPSVESRER